uniref:Uncharacterized protein n=1 Tax=Amphiprion percula TaxID=161767 RepID=A0A3P8U7R6_AMPPE
LIYAVLFYFFQIYHTRKSSDCKLKLDFDCLFSEDSISSFSPEKVILALGQTASLLMLYHWYRFPRGVYDKEITKSHLCQQTRFPPAQLN